ncbi:MAG: hypothetical protein HGB15_01265 [Chlorobaculum sp.]|jgi:hypothetical protein|nr:hypothetical protein [Chlorobaculum sp.]
MKNTTKTKLPYETLPPADTPVWRYMSLAKFIAILRTQSIFLCRADLLDDIFEGSFSEGSLREHAGDGRTYFPENHIALMQWIPCRSFISCWHASEVESAALWKIYAGTEGCISIRSKVGSLQKAFPSIIERTDNLIITQEVCSVQYIDYRTSHPEINDLVGPLCYKRSAFSYEQEIRVIRQEIPDVPKPSEGRPDGRAIKIGVPPDKNGLDLKVNIDEFIEDVYLAPSSPSWLLPTVQDTIHAFGFHNILCRQSSLDELPEFRRIEA